MILGLTSSGAVKIKTDGGLRAVNCACCVPPCPSEEPSPYGIVLSEEQYNNFKSGGNYTMNAVLSETFEDQGSCSSNLNGTGNLIPYSPCGFSVEVREFKCEGMGLTGEAFFQVTWRVFKENDTNLYKLRANGWGYCPYPFFGSCYSVGYFVQDTYDYSPPSHVIQIGSVSLTSKGSNVELAVWTIDAPVFNASASATINIT